MKRTPKLTKNWIKHPRYVVTKDLFTALCIAAGDGQVLVLVGPTQSSKSHILELIAAALRKQFLSKVPGAIPIVDLSMETVSDGRAKPKWLTIELLKGIEHPTYKHMGCLDELEYYKPSRGFDEGTLRIALKEGFKGRCTERVLVDEGHLLTRTKDKELRASILESVKSCCAIERTLIMTGGYELAYKGLFNSAHFAGRLTVVDFGYYDPSNPDDVEAWLSISKTFSLHLNLKPVDLLFQLWEYTIDRSNGVYGLFEKWLWAAKVYADVMKTPITEVVLRQCEPPAAEILEIRKDIAAGRKALAKMKATVLGAKSKPDPILKPKANGAFVRKPNRHAMEEVVVCDED